MCNVLTWYNFNYENIDFGVCIKLNNPQIENYKVYISMNTVYKICYYVIEIQVIDNIGSKYEELGYIYLTPNVLNYTFINLT